MRIAVKGDPTLTCPTVGTWQPVVTEGARIEQGALLGRLRKAGAWHELRAGEGVLGFAREIRPAGWLAYGDPLMSLSRGAEIEGATTDPASADEAGQGVAVRAETDGTIYLRPEPGAPPFAPVGDVVEAHATVALVEVMKTFTPVRTPVGGRVVRVGVDDGEAVGEGAELLRIEPDG